MISVVVTTFNRREMLAKCLQALAEQEFPASNYEIIVVVDGSSDGTQEYLRTLHFSAALRIIDQPNRGLSAARNAGLRAANHEIVLFLDDDLICSPQVLTEHAKAHEQGGNLLAFGPVLVFPSPSEDVAARVTRLHYSNSIYEPLNRGELPAWPVHARVPPNSSIAKNLLLRFGGFDEEFVNTHEDIELGIRLWCDGVRFLYLPKAEAEHVYVKSSEDLAVGEATRAGKAEVMLCRKHQVYRSYSHLARLQNSFYRYRAGDLLLKSLTMGNLFSGALSVARMMGGKFARGAGASRLLGLQSNLNVLRSAVREVGSWRLFQDEFRKNLTVLLYHHVGPSHLGVKPWLTVSTEQFERQIRWLSSHGYVSISPSDWLRWVREGARLPDKPILITFDDAYADLAESALPILHRYQFSATVFVVTERLGGTNTWDELKGVPTLQLMSAEQIRYWAGHEIEFGAHSRTHPDLATLPMTECTTEVVGSKNDLSELLGSPVVSFAYPYGEYNDAVLDLVRGEYDLAFSTIEGLNYLGTDPHLLRRVYIGSNDSMVEFAVKVRRGGMPAWFQALRIKVKLRSRWKRILRYIVPGRTQRG